MSKLRAKEKVVTTAQIENDGYHCCRWCKWCKHDSFDGYICINPVYQGKMTVVAAQVSEDGSLSDTLQEALHSVPEAQKSFMGELTSLLYKWNVSDKRVKEFQKTFSECLDQFLDMDLKGELDSQVSVLYQHVFSDFQPEGVIIEEPLDHYCREFW